MYPLAKGQFLMILNSEIKAQYLFEKETSEMKFPQYQDGSFMSSFKLGFHEYLSLITTRSPYLLLSYPCVCYIPNDVYSTSLPSCGRIPVRRLDIDMVVG